jgi:chorismate mutase
MDTKPPSLPAVRARIDEVDAELLRLIDERSGLARAVAAAKAAGGDAGRFALRPARESQVLRRLLSLPRTAAGPGLVVKIWRELMADSLARQGPFHVACWGGPQPARTVELARLRFGVAPTLSVAARPDEAIAAAKALGGVAVLALAPDNAWWGRLLAEPQLKVFASLPCLSRWGPAGALAVADVGIEPSGGDETFWVTDSKLYAAAIEEALGKTGVAARLVSQAGGLKLFGLSGFFQPQDSRLVQAPGELKGVIGAASIPFDV